MTLPNFPSSFRPVKKEEKKQDFSSFPSSFKPVKQTKEQTPDFFEEGFGPEFERETERHQARNISRFLESTIGLPGDLFDLAVGLTGQEQNILPTSKKLKELSEKLTGGYTAPKEELEKFGDEVFQDIGSMLLPGSKQYNIIRNIGIPLVGNLVKEGINYSGAQEKSAAYTKMGTMIVLDLLSQRKAMGGGVKKYASNLFNEAEKLVPEGAIADATNLEKTLVDLRKTLKMGGERPSTEKSLKKINEILSDVKDGKIGMQELMAYRPSINEIITEIGGYDFKLPAPVKQRASKNLQDVKKATIRTAEAWGKENSPEFLKLNRSANEAWAAIENSNKITKFIEKHAGKYAGPITKTLFGIAPVGGSVGAYLSPATAPIAATTTAGYQTFKIFNRIKNSQTLKKYYNDILTGALKGNAGQVKANLQRLEKSLEREETNSPSFQKIHKDKSQ